jgi:hypothetical protein
LGSPKKIFNQLSLFELFMSEREISYLKIKRYVLDPHEESIRARTSRSNSLAVWVVCRGSINSASALRTIRAGIRSSNLFGVSLLVGVSLLIVGVPPPDMGDKNQRSYEEKME